MNNLIAAKILLTGMINSALRRDGKMINEIIHSCRLQAKTCNVEQSELTRVAEMRICDLIGEKSDKCTCSKDPREMVCPVCISKLNIRPQIINVDESNVTDIKSLNL